jgi:hypothetical protein
LGPSEKPSISGDSREASSPDPQKNGTFSPFAQLSDSFHCQGDLFHICEKSWLESSRSGLQKHALRTRVCAGGQDRERALGADTRLAQRHFFVSTN